MRTITGNIKIFGKGSKERIIQICDFEVLTLLKEYAKIFDLGNKVHEYFLLNRLNKNFSEQSIRLMLKKYQKNINSSKNITPCI